MSEQLSDGIFMRWFNTIRITISPIEWGFIAVVILLALYYLIMGNHKERIFFVVTSIVYIVLVLNPISCGFFEKLIGYHFSLRVYRFYWAFPIYFVFAYSMTKIVIRLHKNSRLKWIFVIFSVVVVVAGVNQVIEGGKHTFLSGGMFSKAENMYKIESNVIHAADLIEADKKEKTVYANVVSDGIVNRELRAYDASLIRVSTDEYFDLFSDTPCDITQEDMISTLKNLNINYIIISSENINNDFLISCGYVLIGETEDEELSYNVYRINSCDLNSNIKTNDN